MQTLTFKNNFLAMKKSLNNKNKKTCIMKVNCKNRVKSQDNTSKKYSISVNSSQLCYKRLNYCRKLCFKKIKQKLI